MFKAMTLLNISAVLLLFTSFTGTASATPLQEKRQIAPTGSGTIRTESLVPLDPSQPLNPALVDLFDQYDNLQRQADSIAESSPDRAKVAQVAAAAKERLELNISGIAALTDAPAPTPTPENPDAADPVTVTVAPSPTGGVGSGKAPVLTIVTQLGTSVIIVASQGRTSTVVLDPVSGAKATRTSGASAGETGKGSSRATSNARTAVRLSGYSRFMASAVALGVVVVML